MNLLFPYKTIRETQKEMMDFISEVLNKKTNALIHAPTGIGKSAAILSVVLPYALEHKLHVLFLTPMHTQHKIIVDTLQEIKKKYEKDFNIVDLVGKRNMCIFPGASNLHSGEFSEYCNTLVKNKNCQFYNNVFPKVGNISPEAKITLNVLNNVIYHTEDLKSIAKESDLCPYEIACLHAKKANLIIADYLHILNPSIRDALIKKTEISLNDCIIVFDESHRLPEKCREVLSAKISSLVIDFAVSEAKFENYHDIANDLEEIRTIFFNLSKKISIEEHEAIITKDELVTNIKLVGDYEQLKGDFDLVADSVREKKKRSFAGSVASFMKHWLGEDQGFVRIIEKGFDKKNKPVITISYNCLDPSLILKELAANVHSVICMSGTLTPIDMYKDLFGFEAEEVEFKNPFPKENKLSLIIPDTTTKYTSRSKEMYERIAKYCADIINSVPGNSAIFFPSYKIRDEILASFELASDKTIINEMQNISKEEKLEIIEKFKSYKNVGAVLLGTSSGNFGEGLDLPGDLLKCVVIVGLPLGKPDLKTQELIKYYDIKFKKGWEYGYTLPALIKSQQNAGRCIRSETDRGIIAYLDARYTWDSYFKIFPKGENLRITKEPVKRIKEFFETNKNL